MKEYVLRSLILLAVGLTAAMPLLTERGAVVRKNLAFKGSITRDGSKTMIRWDFGSGMSTDTTGKSAEAVLVFRTKSPLLTSSGVRGSSVFLNDNGGGEDLVGSDAGFPAGNEPRTAGAWVKTMSMNQPAFFNYGTEAPHERFSLLVSLEGKLMFASVGDDFTGATAVNDGIWHLLLITYDGKNAHLYVDGKLEGSKVCDLKTALRRSWEVGSVRGEFAFFTGMINSLFISNHALSETEIQDLAKNRPTD